MHTRASVYGSMGVFFFLLPLALPRALFFRSRPSCERAGGRARNQLMDGGFGSINHIARRFSAVEFSFCQLVSASYSVQSKIHFSTISSTPLFQPLLTRPLHPTTSSRSHRIASHGLSHVAVCLSVCPPSGSRASSSSSSSGGVGRRARRAGCSAAFPGGWGESGTGTRA